MFLICKDRTVSHRGRSVRCSTQDLPVRLRSRPVPLRSRPVPHKTRPVPLRSRPVPHKTRPFPRVGLFHTRPGQFHTGVDIVLTEIGWPTRESAMSTQKQFCMHGPHRSRFVLYIVLYACGERRFNYIKILTGEATLVRTEVCHVHRGVDQDQQESYKLKPAFCAPVAIIYCFPSFKIL